MSAVKCPVCEGSGVYISREENHSKRRCHGCDGKGWVVVPPIPLIPITEIKKIRYSFTTGNEFVF